MNNKGNMYIERISLYNSNPNPFTNLNLPLVIQSRKRNYYVCQFIGCQKNHPEHLKAEYLDTIYPATFVEYWSTQLKQQTKAWQKCWSFQCVVSLVRAI